jgi:hypothetical protein
VLSQPRPAPDYAICSRCGRWGAGHTVEFAVGRKSRGQNPRTLAVDLRILKVESVFVCHDCERQLFWLGVRRQLKSPEVLGAIVLPGLWLGFSIHRGLSSKEPGRDLLIGIAALVTSLIGLGVRWRSKRTRFLRELLFESRRREYARQLECPAALLAVHPPPESHAPGAMLRAG